MGKIYRVKIKTVRNVHYKKCHTGTGSVYKKCHTGTGSVSAC
jgi:hypothetical protein